MAISETTCGREVVQKLWLCVAWQLGMVRGEWRQVDTSASWDGGGWVHVWHWGDGRVRVQRVEGRLGVNDVVAVMQRHGLAWCGHVLGEHRSGWVSGCMDCEVEHMGRRGGPVRTSIEVVEEDCHTRWV